MLTVTDTRDCNNIEIGENYLLHLPCARVKVASVSFKLKMNPANYVLFSLLIASSPLLAQSESIRRLKDQFAYLGDRKMALVEAVNFCNQLSGHLPSVNSIEDIDELNKVFNLKSTSLWLGAKAINFTNNRLDFQWMDDSSFENSTIKVNISPRCVTNSLCGLVLFERKVYLERSIDENKPICILPKVNHLASQRWIDVQSSLSTNDAYMQQLSVMETILGVRSDEEQEMKSLKRITYICAGFLCSILLILITIAAIALRKWQRIYVVCDRPSDVQVELSYEKNVTEAPIFRDSQVNNGSTSHFDSKKTTPKLLEGRASKSSTVSS